MHYWFLHPVQWDGIALHQSSHRPVKLNLSGLSSILIKIVIPNYYYMLDRTNNLFIRYFKNKKE